MEMVTAIAIFSIIILIVINIFLTATKSHRLVMEEEKLQGDARFAMETMAREARMDLIDYDYYANNDNGQVDEPEDVLALEDLVNNEQIIFKKASDEYCPDSESQPCLEIGDGNGNWQSITPAGVKLIHLSFYISPTEDPFYLNKSAIPWQYGPDIQPRVTIVLATQSTAPLPGGNIPEVIYLQTTITSRIYRR